MFSPPTRPTKRVSPGFGQRRRNSCPRFSSPPPAPTRQIPWTFRRFRVSASHPRRSTSPGYYASNTSDVSTLPGFGQSPPTLNVPGTHFGATVLLGLTVPIYDGGLRRALEGQARADAARTDARLEQIRDEATREIVAAANRVRTSLSALDAADALVSATQITFDAALDAYRDGVGSITDTTRAETALLEAQNASADAYSAALSSAATLALAAGTLGAAPE